MGSTQGRRNLVIGSTFVAALAVLGACQALLENKAATSGPTVQAPMFEVDPLWPKPLPNHWLLGWTIGVWVDDQDHVWVIHRGAGGLHVNEKGLEQNPPISECCRTAPPVLVFDPAGNLVSRIVVTDSGTSLRGKKAYDRGEFIASADERFRPVYLSSAPDGTLYVGSYGFSSGKLYAFGP